MNSQELLENYGEIPMIEAPCTGGVQFVQGLTLKLADAYSELAAAESALAAAESALEAGLENANTAEEMRQSSEFKAREDAAKAEISRVNGANAVNNADWTNQLRAASSHGQTDIVAQLCPKPLQTPDSSKMTAYRAVFVPVYQAYENVLPLVRAKREAEARTARAREAVRLAEDDLMRYMQRASVEPIAGAFDNSISKLGTYAVKVREVIASRVAELEGDLGGK